MCTSTAATGISHRLNIVSRLDTLAAVTVDIYFFFFSLSRSCAQREGGNANTAMRAMTNKKTKIRNAKATALPQSSLPATRRVCQASNKQALKF